MNLKKRIKKLEREVSELRVDLEFILDALTDRYVEDADAKVESEPVSPAVPARKE